jgi:hypothetical protein
MGTTKLFIFEAMAPKYRRTQPSADLKIFMTDQR